MQLLQRRSELRYAEEGEEEGEEEEEEEVVVVVVNDLGVSRV